MLMLRTSLTWKLQQQCGAMLSVPLTPVAATQDSWLIDSDSGAGKPHLISLFITAAVKEFPNKRLSQKS